jgi:hypothetical protein
VIRCAFGLAGSGIEFDDIGCFLSWLFSTRKETPGLRGRRGQRVTRSLARAPVDDAGRAGSMSVNTERPRELENQPSRPSSPGRTCALLRSADGLAIAGRCMRRAKAFQRLRFRTS